MAIATGAASGRASARETASRVAAGGVARLVIPEVDDPRLCRRARRRRDRSRRVRRCRRSTPIPSSAPTPPPPRAGRRWSTRRARTAARSARSSNASRPACRAGWGAPLYAKLDAELAAAMMSINAVKGVEIGDGFAAARLRGEENADAMRAGPDGAPHFLSNHAGGVLGGISSGQPVVVRVAFKPTSSILTPQPTHRPAGRRDRDRHQGPPRSLRRHPRRAGGRGDDGAGPRRPETAPPRPVRRAAR